MQTTIPGIRDFSPHFLTGATRVVQRMRSEESFVKLIYANGFAGDTNGHTGQWWCAHWLLFTLHHHHHLSSGAHEISRPFVLFVVGESKRSAVMAIMSDRSTGRWIFSANRAIAKRRITVSFQERIATTAAVLKVGSSTFRFLLFHHHHSQLSSF